jgi:adenosylhomocysteinase
VILFDIGGYFAEIGKNWPQEILSKIELIVEDTENGHQKYEAEAPSVKVVSVARSPLKDNEDFLVGQSILFSADAILRREGILLQYLKCSVLGFGKIGKSISFHLLQRGVKPSVFDINPIKRIESYNNLCAIPSRSDVIYNADIIFSATGNKSLDVSDFRKVKDGCFIFSVTSSDDEFHFNFDKNEYQIEEKDKIFKYSNNNNFFFLVNNGNAVNFLHNAVMGDFIHLVRTEMLFAPMNLNSFSANKINYVNEDLRKRIADLWLDMHNPY